MQAPGKPRDETARLKALHSLNILDTAFEERFDRLTRLCRMTLGTEIVLISLVDENCQWLKSCQGLDVRETGRDVSFCGHAIHSDEILEIPDAQRDARFHDNPLVTGPPYIRFYAGAPLRTEAGHRVGTLCLIDRQPRELTVEERQALRDFADTVETELNREAAYQLHQSLAQQKGFLTRQLKALEVLNTIAADRSLSLEQQMQQVLSLGADFLGLDIGIISQIDDDDYRVLYCISPEGVDLAPGQTFKLGQTYCDLALQSDEVLAIHHMADSSHHGHPCYSAFGLESYIGIRFQVAGNDTGTVNFSSSRPQDRPFTDSETLFVQLLAGWVAAALERDRTLRALQLSESRLRALFELAPIGIALNDFETGQFLDLNQALLVPTGYTREEFVRLSYWKVTPIEYQPEEEKALADLQERGRYGPFEKEYIRKDGSRYPVRLLGTRVEDAKGRQLIWSIIEDISERRRVEQMKNEFISTVSHELRTPLTSISGSLKLLNSGAVGAFPDAAKQMLEIAHDNSERLLLLINDLLDIEKLVSGKLQISLKAHALMPIVQAAVQGNQAYADQFSVTFHLARTDVDPVVAVDRDRLLQVLANLLSNAAKFSPEGDAVTIAVTVLENAARVTVSDNGPGIPEIFRDQLFEKFSQLDASDHRSRSGTGLGLAISRELIEQMHGQIDVDTQPGKGSSFYFDLPEVTGEPDEP